MKRLILPAAICLMLTACGPESSPEGRMGIKIDHIQKSLNQITALQQQVDSLKVQNAIILDSLTKLSREVITLKK